MLAPLGLPWLAWHAAAFALGGPLQLPNLALPPDSRTHELARDMRLNGVAVVARILDIALPIEEAVPALAVQFPAPPAILRDGGQVILAAADTRWLLTLGARGRRTLGVMSMLAPPAAGAVAARSTAPSANRAAAAMKPLLGWLPPGVEQRLDLSSRDRGTRTAQHIFVHPRLSPPQLMQQAFAGLLRDGWTSNQAPQAAISVWRRGPARLMLSIVPAGKASGLLAVVSVADTPISDTPGYSATRMGPGHE